MDELAEDAGGVKKVPNYIKITKELEKIVIRLYANWDVLEKDCIPSCQCWGYQILSEWISSNG